MREAAKTKFLTKHGPAWNSPNEVILTDLAIAGQWRQRFSEDNVNMVGFQLSNLVRVVKGLPVLVASCEPKTFIQTNELCVQ